MMRPNELRIYVADMSDAQTQFNLAATSIRVELSRRGNDAVLFGILNVLPKAILMFCWSC